MEAETTAQKCPITGLTHNTFFSVGQKLNLLQPITCSLAWSGVFVSVSIVDVKGHVHI